MSQMNPKEFVHNTANSVQLPYILHSRSLPLKSLYLSTCSTVSQSSGIPQEVSHLVCMQNAELFPFNSSAQGSRERALPERAPIANWSGYKTVLDIVALCYSYFLT